ncbi:MAG: DUF86 domain-containing protein [Candidatus Hydrogenedentes bacterium]|nr:DUF86 domain-containing protein [Candidatus Hydrogenedentota bacterium]
MPPRSVALYLSDIIEAAESIQSFVEGQSFDEYRKDRVLRPAVERNFIIIGEALNQAIQMDTGLATEISDAHQIVRVRHRLTHGYFTVADDIIWGIIKDHLATLIAETRRALGERDARRK